MLDVRSRHTARWFLVKLTAFALLAGATAMAAPPQYALAVALRCFTLSCGIGAIFCGVLCILRTRSPRLWLDPGDEALAFAALATLLRIAARLT
jgi:hypothetical protein